MQPSQEVLFFKRLYNLILNRMIMNGKMPLMDDRVSEMWKELNLGVGEQRKRIGLDRSELKEEIKNIGNEIKIIQLLSYILLRNSFQIVTEQQLSSKHKNFLSQLFINHYFKFNHPAEPLASSTTLATSSAGSIQNIKDISKLEQLTNCSYKVQKHTNQKLFQFKYIIQELNYTLFKNNKFLIIPNHLLPQSTIKNISYYQIIPLGKQILIKNQIYNNNYHLSSETIKTPNQLSYALDSPYKFNRFTDYFILHLGRLYHIIMARGKSSKDAISDLKAFLEVELKEKRVQLWVNGVDLKVLRMKILSSNSSILISILKTIIQLDYFQALQFPEIILQTYQKCKFNELIQNYLNLKFNNPYFNHPINTTKMLYQTQSIIHKFNNDEIFDLREINNHLRSMDILCMKRYWEVGLADYIHYVIGHWQMFRGYLSRQVLMFAYLNDYNIQKFKFCKNVDLINNNLNLISIYEQVYEGITYLTKRILRLFNKYPLQQHILNQRNNMKIPIRFNYSNSKIKYLKNYQQRYQIQTQKITNQIFQIFVKEEIEKLKGNNTNLKNLKIRLNDKESANIYEFVMNFQGFRGEFGYWNDLFTQTRGILQSEFKKQRNSQLEKGIYYNEKMVQHQCLGCSTFFYLHKNIYDENVNRIPLKSFHAIKEIKNYEAQLKDYICSMINSGGGIILFDCRLQLKRIIIHGSILTQKQKQQFENRIYSYLNQFYPKLLPKFNVMVEFVPIINPNEKSGELVRYSGEDSFVKRNRFYLKRQYMRNCYVTRIRVIPTNNQKVYFWFTSSDKFYNKRQVINKYCSVLNQGVSKQLTMSQMTKLIKNKFAVYQLLHLTEKHNDGPQPINHFQHICKDPEKNMQRQYQSLIINNQPIGSINYEQNFKNVALLYYQKEQQLKKFKELLRKQQIKYEIQSYFSSYKFKAAENRVFIYFNKKLSLLKDYLLHQNKMSLTSITSFIKFIKITLEQFKKYKRIFRTEFSQYIKFYEFHQLNGQKQYYFQTQSKKSTAFLYFLIKQKKNQILISSQYHEPTLICPLLLDKMSQEQRERQFILLYEQRDNRQVKEMKDTQNEQQTLQFSYQFYENLSSKGIDRSQFKQQYEQQQYQQVQQVQQIESMF